MYSTEQGQTVVIAVRLSGAGLTVNPFVSKAGSNVFTASLNTVLDMGDGFYSLVLNGTEVDQLGPVVVAFKVSGVTQGFEIVQVTNALSTLTKQIRGFQTSGILQPLMENAAADRKLIEGQIRDLLGTQIMDLKRGVMSKTRK